MKRLFELLSQFRILLLFILLEIIGISLLAYYNSYQHSVMFNAFREFAGGIYKRVDNAKRYFHLRKVNDSLLAENALLQSELNSIYYREKNIRADKFDSNNKFKYIYKPARVINNSVDKRKNYMIINLGSKQGIDKNMAVITDKGIVGVVKDVSENYALILSVLNSDFKLNAKIKETNDVGSVSWDGRSPDIVVLKDIPNQNLIKKGNHVVVGPYSQYFPENIPIGTIIGSRLDKSGGFFNLYIHLNDDFRKIVNVYVIRNLNISEPAALEQKIPQ